jgi:hypothetical protein
MKKNRTQNQPEASAPENYSMPFETVEERIDERTVLMMRDEYRKLARAITTIEDCVCWILDLQDEGAMILAQALHPDVSCEEIKKNALQLNAVPTIGTATEFEYLSIFLKGMGDECLPPPPLGFHYVVIVAAGSHVVTLQSAIALEQQGLN